MRKFISTAIASAMTASVFATGAIAAPMAPSAPVHAAPGDVVQVRDWDHRGGWRNGGRQLRGGEFRRSNRQNFNSYARGDGYYNGYSGSRYHHHGWRERNGWFYPGAAFLGGAIIGGLIERSDDIDTGYRSRGRLSSAHVEWCYDRYRSYRAGDNSFQPYNGPRQQCYSPYS